MYAFAESLENNWEAWGLEPLEYRYMNKGKTSMGRLFNQSTKAEGIKFKLFYLLFIDDGAFMFNSKEQLIKGADLIYEHFRKFGLKMHVGENNIASKTEVMHFPADLNRQNLTMDKTVLMKYGELKVTNNFSYLGVNINNNIKDIDEIKNLLRY